MFKDFLDYKDPKKGYIVNDTYNNPTILDTGFHQYKNIYNFYNNTKAGQIGAVKSIVNQNNNILWTPNQANNVEMNLLQSTSTTSTNPDNFLPEDIGIDYDSYWEWSYTTIGGYTIYDFVCDCYSKGTVSVPVAIQILDYNLNGKISFVWIGIDNSVTKGIEGYCSALGYNIDVSYQDINYYIIASAGTIPAPLYGVHWDYWQPFEAKYFIPTPGSINLNYIDWRTYCELRKKGYPSGRFWFEVYELKIYINGCNNGVLYLWERMPYGSLPPGEYVKVRVYEKKISKICV